MRRLDLADVREASERLRPYLAPTPLRPCQAIETAGVWIKLECWQPTGSFKVRGALNALASLSRSEASGALVTASAGNHGLGVAFAADTLRLGRDVTVFVPETTPEPKLTRLARFPVNVLRRGAGYDEACRAAHVWEREYGARFVHAFDDPDVAAGQGTVALEILEQLPDVGSVLVPVGGGGLVSGMAVALKALRPAVRVVAVQPEASPALRESLTLGRPLLEYPATPTLADGVAGGIGEIVFEHRDLVDEVVVVTEAEIEAAMVALLARDQVVAEGSGALGVAALLAGRLPSALPGPFVSVVTGGNVDVSVLSRLLAERA